MTRLCRVILCCPVEIQDRVHRKRRVELMPGVETIVYELLCAKATGLGGTVFAIGGVEDHVHMVVSIPPKVALATFVGQCKGVASAKLNRLRAGRTNGIRGH